MWRRWRHWHRSHGTRKAMAPDTDGERPEHHVPKRRLRRRRRICRRCHRFAPSSGRRHRTRAARSPCAPRTLELLGEQQPRLVRHIARARARALRRRAAAAAGGAPSGRAAARRGRPRRARTSRAPDLARPLPRVGRRCSGACGARSEREGSALGAGGGLLPRDARAAPCGAARPRAPARARARARNRAPPRRNPRRAPRRRVLRALRPRARSRRRPEMRAAKPRDRARVRSTRPRPAKPKAKPKTRAHFFLVWLWTRVSNPDMIPRTERAGWVGARGLVGILRCARARVRMRCRAGTLLCCTVPV